MCGEHFEALISKWVPRGRGLCWPSYGAKRGERLDHREVIAFVRLPMGHMCGKQVGRWGQTCDCAKLIFIENPVKKWPLTSEGNFLFGHKTQFDRNEKNCGPSVRNFFSRKSFGVKSVPPCAGRNFGETLHRRVLAEILGSDDHETFPSDFGWTAHLISRSQVVRVGLSCCSIPCRCLPSRWLSTLGSLVLSSSGLLLCRLLTHISQPRFFDACSAGANWILWDAVLLNDLWEKILSVMSPLLLT